MAHGSCLCGKVAYEIAGTLPEAVACHCAMCRKHTGHFLVSVEVDKTALTIADTTHLKWYRSSDKARRGFCGQCGSTLFFDAIYRSWIAVTLGTITAPTQTAIALHIFTAFKGDYYHIDDNARQE